MASPTNGEPSSILHSVSVPEPFDSITSSSQSHLLSPFKPFLNGIPPSFKLLCDPPPNSPYQPQKPTRPSKVSKRKRKEDEDDGGDDQSVDGDTSQSSPKRPRPNPNQNISAENTKKILRSKADLQTDQHHEQIRPFLQASIKAIRNGWIERVSSSLSHGFQKKESPLEREEKRDEKESNLVHVKPVWWDGRDEVRILWRGGEKQNQDDVDFWEGGGEEPRFRGAKREGEKGGMIGRRNAGTDWISLSRARGGAKMGWQGSTGSFGNGTDDARKFENRNGVGKAGSDGRADVDVEVKRFGDGALKGLGDEIVLLRCDSSTSTFLQNNKTIPTLPLPVSSLYNLPIINLSADSALIINPIIPIDPSSLDVPKSSPSNIAKSAKKGNIGDAAPVENRRKEDGDGEIKLLMPPRCGFLMAEMQVWEDGDVLREVGELMGGWDLVVIDPPWPNKSASRSSSYGTMEDIYDLLRIDLPRMLRNRSHKGERNRGCQKVVVGVWVTNKVKFRDFITRKLFPHWKVNGPFAEWYWVKITGNHHGEGNPINEETGAKFKDAGKPIWDIDSKHRRCYEGLILGIYQEENNPMAGASSSTFNINPSSPEPSRPTLPKREVFFSIPLGHSRKPVILDLVRPYLQSQHRVNCLELFARSLCLGRYNDSESHSKSTLRKKDALFEKVFSGNTSHVVDGEVESQQEKWESQDFENGGMYFSVGNEAAKFAELGVGWVKSV